MLRHMKLSRDQATAEGGPANLTGAVCGVGRFVHGRRSLPTGVCSGWRRVVIVVAEIDHLDTARPTRRQAVTAAATAAAAASTAACSTATAATTAGTAASTADTAASTTNTTTAAAAATAATATSKREASAAESDHWWSGS
jgi:hypothetical protein